MVIFLFSFILLGHIAFSERRRMENFLGKPTIFGGFWRLSETMYNKFSVSIYFRLLADSRDVIRMQRFPNVRH
jgi:hypothetical protein